MDDDIKLNGTPMRSNDEAWELAVEHSDLMWSIFNKFLNTHYNVWFDRKGLSAELESYAWEGMYKACRLWDEDKGALSTYAYPAVERYLLRGYERTLRMGFTAQGNYAKGETKDPVSLYSYNYWEEENPEFEISSFLDWYRQPWQTDIDNGEFEDDVVIKVDAERLRNKLFPILERMTEPHRSVFEVAHLRERESDPHIAANLNIQHGAQHSYSEIGEILDMPRATVREVLQEAEEFVRFQLEEMTDYDQEE